MNSKRLTEVVMAIREYAGRRKYTIYHELETDDWASQMLDLISDEVVNAHLSRLHPFQFVKGNDATQVYEFRVDYYRYQASIKVNLRQLEVLSFHDAQPRDEEITTRFSDIAIIPETASIGTDYSSYKIKRLIGYSCGNALFILTNPMLCHYDKSLPPKKGGKPSSFRGWFFLFIAFFSPRGKIAKR